MPKLDIHRRELQRIRETVSHHLRWYREYREITLEQVAAESGITMRRLNQIEQGEQLPSLPELYVLAAILETGGMLTLVEGA